ncbi:23 kDa integral membrane protein-like [Uranotaenia lowii]|uniref:23 kDa integral membrane protein-like n=1 Tax=Uranotaenia lowii TaxID=190385 RepID=UPI00247B2CF3|nr:23 kDa integral membrane protein-like [Uranotaenia lowii]
MTDSIWTAVCRIGLMVLNALLFTQGLAQAIGSIVATFKAVDIMDTRAMFGATVIGAFEGCIICALATAGFCGAWQNSPKLLTIYRIVLVVLIVIEILLVIWMLVISGNVDGILQHSGDDSKPNKLMDWLQEAFDCCGEKSYSEYGSKIPQSCCRSGVAPKCEPFPLGCVQVVTENLKSVAYTFTFSYTIIIVLQIVALAMVTYLKKAIRQSE